jgi:aspartate racemase
MQGGYIKGYFETDDIKTLIPTEQDMLSIDQIRKKVFDGSIKDSEIEAYRKLIYKYHQKSPVVIACTELSVLQESLKMSNVFDLAMLQMRSSLNGDCT